MTQFNALLRGQTDRSRPYVTFLAEAARVELSVTSFANAADKIANALLSEGFADSGDQIAIHVPWHWQRSVWCAGAWLIGAGVVPWGNGQDASCTVADPLTSAKLSEEHHRNLLTVSLHPLGLGSPSDIPRGAIDATALVRIQPDVFLGDPSAPDDVALTMDGSVWTQSDCIVQAQALPKNQRIGMREAENPMSWILPVWYPAVGSGSVVLASLDVDVTAERVTEYRVPD